MVWDFPFFGILLIFQSGVFVCFSGGISFDIGLLLLENFSIVVVFVKI